MDFGAFITEFQRRLDAAESLADMLATNARLISPAGVVEGAAAIDAHVTARRPEQVVRHCWNNLRVAGEGETRVTLRYIATAWHGDPSGALRTMTLGDVCDVLERQVDGTWRLRESRFDRIYKHKF